MSLETCQKVDSQSKVMPEAKQACTYVVVESTIYGSHSPLAPTVRPTKTNIHRKTIGFVFVSVAYCFATRLRISAAEYGPRLADIEVGQLQQFSKDMKKFKI